MTLRIKIFVSLMVAMSTASVWAITGHAALHWDHFLLYLVAILLSSGMKVGFPKSEGTASVNFPFIFLGILQLSPLQAVGLAAFSVLAMCRIRVIHRFTVIQTLFNVATVTTATVLTWYAYVTCLPLVLQQTAPAMAIAAIAYYFANT